MPVYGQVGIDNLLHALTEFMNIIGRNRTVETHIDIVAVRHRDINDHRTVWPQVVGGLVQHKEKRSRIGSDGRRIMEIKELNILRFIDPIVHSFYLVIDTCADGTILHF